MSTPLRLLLVEDSTQDAALLIRLLRHEGFSVVSERVETAGAMIAALDRQSWDLVIADYNLPSFSAVAALEVLRQRRSDVPLIIASGTISEEVAVECMKLGAVDYMLKDRLGRLGKAVRQALDEQRLRAEKRQADQQIRFQARLLDTVEQAVIAADLEGAITYWNRFAERLYGWTAAEMRGRPILDLVPAAVAGAQPAKIMARLRTDVGWCGELFHQGSKGSAFPVGVTESPIFDESGALIGRVTVSTDITERKRTEEALRHSETCLREQLRRLPIPTYIWQREGDSWILVDYNLAAEQITFGKIGILLGTTAHDLYRREPEVLDNFIRCWHEQSTITQEARYSFQTTGDTRDLICSYTFVPPEMVLVHTIDITERKQAAKALEQAKEAAEGLARLRDDFVAAVSHELRTPLTAMVGFSELLQTRWGRFSESHRLDLVGHIVQAANRQQRLVGDLLMLSRIDASMAVSSDESVPLDVLVQNAVAEVQSSYPGQIIIVNGPTDLEVRVDAGRATQVLANVLDNAAKYSPQGSPIALSWRAEGRLAVVRVVDKGSGVPAEGRERLFTRFGRLPGSRIRSGHVGTGLGLYISRGLAEAMGGDLELETTGPEGSTFRLRFPACSSKQVSDRTA